MPPLRIVFAGSPAAAVPSLRALQATEHELCAVVTREDAPQGRKRILTATPVADYAKREQIPLILANRLGPVSDELVGLRADLGVVVAYGGLIREPVLSAPTHGWINLHFSLLPRWRGAAPVQRAIIAGDTETGASVFQLVPELDAGPVFATERVAIGRHETAGHLLEVLAESGAELLRRVVDEIADGTAHAEDQEGTVTLAPKLTLDDGRLDFSAPAREVIDRLRGVTPEPGAFTTLGDDRVKVLDAIVAHGAPALPVGQLEARAGQVLVGTATEPVELVTVHPAGKRAMPAADWWRGRAVGAVTVAGQIAAR